MNLDIGTIATIGTLIIQGILALMQARLSSDIAGLKVYMHEHFVSRDELRPVNRRNVPS